MPASSKRRLLERILPAALWLPGSLSTTFRADAVAGLALACLLVPEAVAYAGIAGVPPQAGLFAAAAGLLLYALFGTSRHLAVSPTSGSAAMLAALVGAMALGDGARYMALASATAIAVGAIFVIASVLKLGFAAEFISKPVHKGFVFGLALTIMMKQGHKLLGVGAGHGDFFDQLWQLLVSVGQTNLWTLGVGLTALAVMFALGKIAPRVPSALVVFVLGILATKLLGLGRHGVEVVGHIPSGLPRFGLPQIARADVPGLFSGAVGITLILAAESLTAARTFAARFRYTVDTNLELRAIGGANIASGISQGIVVGGGMSGTAANADAGARSELSAITASLIVMLTLLVLMPLFRELPEAVLAAVVIHAVAHLADVAELRRYARLRTGSIWIAVTALVGVLALGILQGLVLAVALTLVALMRRVSAPQDAVLGRLPGTHHFVDVKHHPEAELIPGLVIFRPNAVLFFANANRILNRIRAIVKASAPPIGAIVLDLEASPEIDVTFTDALDDLRDELESAGTAVYLARVADEVRDLLGRTGFIGRLGDDRILWGIDDAVAAARRHVRAGAR